MGASEEDHSMIEPELIRSVAREEIATLIEGRRSLTEQHLQSFRWLVASLLAINSGAIIAVLNLANLVGAVKVQASSLFTLGVILSLMVAYSSQKLCNFLIPTLQEKIGYWLGVVQDGELCPEADKEISSKAQKILKFKWVPECFGWLALAAFIGGLAIIGNAISDEETKLPIEIGEGASL